MSIEFAKSYKTSDGMCHATLTAARAHELALLFGGKDGVAGFGIDYIIDVLVGNADKVVNILTMTERSRPKARGSKKPRKNRVTEPATTTAA